MIFDDKDALQSYRTWCSEHTTNMESVVQSPLLDHIAEVSKSLVNGSVVEGNYVRVMVYKVPTGQNVFQDILNIAWRKATQTPVAGLVQMTMSKDTKNVAFTMIYDSAEALEHGKRALNEMAGVLGRG